MPRMTDTPFDAAMSLSKQDLARRLIEAEQMLVAERIIKAELFKELNELGETMAGKFKKHEIQWAVNVLLEKIAAKFEANETMDIWRSDAAALVRSFKHDLAAPSPS